MIEEEKQDLAVEYVLGSLNVSTQREFEAELTRDLELKAFVDEMSDCAAALAHSVPARTPPPQLRERILANIRGGAAPAVVQTVPVERSDPRWFFLPWAVAAGLAISAAAFWSERAQWREEALALRKEALALRTKDTLAQVRIATLSAQVESYSKGVAVVIWDSEKQRGIVKLSNVPQAEPGKDYQLWVLDPKYPQPVSGGIVPVGADGIARVAFTPEKPTRTPEKFAISIERAGGAPEPGGPIVLLGK